ncbi:MAG: M16 family metallopeptidase [Solirubrobacteraceae bacterium]
MAEESHRTSTLPSGLRVVSERMESVRSVALGCLVGTGSAFEPADRAGISHLLEHMLFRGTERHASEEIDQIFDAMGSELDAETDRETTTLSTRVLDEHVPQALEVMSEMLWRPKMERLGAEKEVVLEEIAAYEDDPQALVFDVMGETVFGSHPLGRPVIGSAQTVSAVTDSDLRAYHGERYVPSNVVIAAAGSVDHDELVRIAAELEPGDAGDAPASDEAPLEPPSRTVRFLVKPTEQCHVCIGGRGIARGDERRFALRVLDVVLGGGPSSRLFQQVREQRGLAYSVFSFSALHANAGEIGVYVGTRPENLRQALATIVAELERAREEPASQAELDRARQNVKGRIVLALESTGARMARLGASELYGLPLLSIDETIERIDAVDVPQLRELASELLDPARLSVAAIGPDEAGFERALGPLQAVAA